MDTVIRIYFSFLTAEIFLNLSCSCALLLTRRQDFLDVQCAR